MELSICANYLQKTELNDKSSFNMFRLCKEAGFTVVDYTPAGNTWEQQVASLNRASELLELPIEQSHAPFNRYKKMPMENYKVLLDHAFEAAIRMHNKQIVVHGDDYRVPEGEEYDAEDAMKQMYELWAPYVELAAKNDLCVAFETVFEDNRAKDAPPNRFTSRLDELIGLIDRFNDPHAVCCWDSGHARLAFTGEGMPDAMRTLGSRIICTHIHDNYYNRDLHVMPFYGDIDWRVQMATLKEIGYKGNLTFEFVYGNLPDQMVADFLHTARKIGGMLKQMFDEA
ncbi:MAG: sugar phosphate isomerase/epimerase [Clostridia bacterium]|nr:sugar phosphate isomerase/epimerase [Clostridia bacterium]